jgi:3',5'-nucleoside bisphosphate phosphatase
MIPCTPLQADLHNHTTCSDGEYDPAELVQAAVAAKLEAIAITDHDTVDGLEEAADAAERLPITFICGAEITVRFAEKIFRGSLHLLIYFSHELLSDPAFLKDTKITLEKGRGDALTEARIEAINRLFGPGVSESFLPRKLTMDDLQRHGHLISRRHFALALNDLGITDKSDVSGIIGNDSPAYIPSGVPMNSLRSYLARWPLVRILAHPAAGSFPGDSHYKEVLPPLETVETFMPEFLEAGLDGLELCYPGHTPELIDRLNALRKRLDLKLITGGSDCHDKSVRPLGVSGVSMPYAEQLIRECDARLQVFRNFRP